MSENQNAVMEFTIHVTAKASPETKETIDKLKQAKKEKNGKTDQPPTTEEEQFREEEPETAEQLSQGKIISEGELKSFDTDPFFKQPKEGEEGSLSKEVTDTFNKIDSQGLGTLSKIASNPGGTIADELTKVLAGIGPEGIALVSALGVVIASPEIVSSILNALSVPGGPLNRDWKRNISTEVDAGLSRQLVRQREVGIDQVIISQQKGYVVNNTDWNYNSYFNITAARISRIGLNDRASGVLQE